jgi:hypothetical protein
LGLIISDEGKKFYNIDTWVKLSSTKGVPAKAVKDRGVSRGQILSLL